MSSLFGGGFGSTAASAPFYTTPVEQSLRFDKTSNGYLTRTVSSATETKIGTFSCWAKRGKLSAGTAQMLISGEFGGDPTNIFWSTLDKIYIQDSAGTSVGTSARFRDASSWYHICVAWDTTQATSSDRISIYVNGVKQTNLDATTYPSLNAAFNFNKASSTVYIGNNSLNNSDLDGYLAEVYHIDGTAYTADAFGEFNNGVWVPKTPSVTYGTNGFYLPLSADFNDDSGNGNNFTGTSVDSTDLVIDGPTNNFATLNVLSASATIAEGSLKASQPSTASNVEASSTFAVSSGKYYIEFYANNASASDSTTSIGITSNSIASFFNWKADASYTGLSGSPTLTTYTSADILAFALNLDDGEITLYKNNSLVGGGALTLSNTITEEIGIRIFLDNVTGRAFTVNFGQDSTFANSTTAGGNSDDNGYGDFKYAPPSGYLALCAANLPEPTIGPNSATTSDQHFNTLIYTGNGAEDRAITGLGFQPDLTWFKSRNQNISHQLFDVIRTAGQVLRTDSTGAESTYAAFDSFDSDGFTISNAGLLGTNANSYTYVAWNWKADNTSGSSNTDGTITSTVTANVGAGFSIASYTGTGANATFGHGLTQTPEIVILKNRTTGGAGYDWTIYTGIIDGSLDYLFLNLTSAKADSGLSAPNSSVVSLGAGVGTNASGANFIAYCFHSVEGYSKIGTYEGNGSSDGAFVYTGFRPAFVICKSIDSTSSWYMYDNQREGYNVDNDYLLAETTGTEGTTDHIDLLSNGFKLRISTDPNVAETYIYMAFAETPFKYANAR